MAGRPRIDWGDAYAYWIELDPWYPGQLGEYELYRRTRLVEALRPRERRRTYANVARRFGVSRQAVWRYATTHGWPEQLRRAALARTMRAALADLAAPVGSAKALPPPLPRPALPSDRRRP